MLENKQNDMNKCRIPYEVTQSPVQIVFFWAQGITHNMFLICT